MNLGAVRGELLSRPSTAPWGAQSQSSNSRGPCAPIAAVRARFVTEARLLAALDHPHVVPVFDFVEKDGLCLLVMELLPGGTVWSRFGGNGFTPPAACATVLAASAGLAGRAREKRPAPRRQTREPDVLVRGRLEGNGFRDRQGSRRRFDVGHQGRRGAGHAGVYSARAGAGGAAFSGDRCLRPGHHAVRTSLRATSFSGRRGRHGAVVQARLRGPDATRPEGA